MCCGHWRKNWIWRRASIRGCRCLDEFWRDIGSEIGRAFSPDSLCGPVPRASPWAGIGRAFGAFIGECSFVWFGNVRGLIGAFIRCECAMLEASQLRNEWLVREMAELECGVFYHDRCFDGACSASVFTRFHRECVKTADKYSYHGLVHRAGALFDESAFVGGENAIV